MTTFPENYIEIWIFSMISEDNTSFFLYIWTLRNAIMKWLHLEKVHIKKITPDSFPKFKKEKYHYGRIY